MRKIIIMFCALCITGISQAGENSAAMQITSIESRESGAHALYFTGTVPSQGCVYENRAIIVEADIGAKTLLSVALTALSTQKNVVVRVDGCTPLSPPDTTATSPHVIKLQIYK